MNRIKNRRIAAMAATAAVAAVLFTGCTNERLADQHAFRQVGITALQNGDYEGALAAFDTALSYSSGQIGQTEIDICYYKAATQYASGDNEGALATYNAILDYDKKDANAYYMRGCLYLQNGDTEKAKADFKSAVEHNASDYALYINIYENLCGYNFVTEGEEYLNQAFSIKGDDARQLAYRGEIYYLLGQYENAKTELAAALEKESTEANLTMAQVCEAEGDTQKAQTYYQAYVDSGAADSAAFLALAEIEMAKLNYAGALTYIDQGLALEEVTNRRELMQNQIICMEYTSDFAGAFAVIQEYIAMYPDDMEAQREYIFLKHRQGVQQPEESPESSEQGTEAGTEGTEAGTEGTEAAH